MAQPIIYSDLDSKMELDGSGDIRIATNAEAVRVSLANIMNVMVGEVPMLRSFASILRQRLFEQNDQLSLRLATQAISKFIPQWDSRIVIQDVTINPNEGGVFISVSASVAGLGDSITLSTNLTR